MTMRIFRVGLLLLMAQLSLTASAGEFEDLRSKYQERKLEIDLASKKEKDALLEKYASAVGQIQEKLQAAGDLDGVVAARKEIEVAKEGALFDHGEAGAPGWMKEVRAVAEAELGKILEKRQGEIDELDGKYVEALHGIKTSLTKSGKLEEAVAVLKEIEQVSHREQVPDTGVIGWEDLPESLQKGLVAWFPFNEDENPTVVSIDPSGMEGQLKGTSFLEEGRIGGARLFNGENERVELGKQIPDSERFTIAAWVKYAGTPGRGAIFSDFDGRNANDLMFSISTMESMHIRADKDGDKMRTILALPKPLTTEWHHVVWAMHSRDSLLYVDGEKVAEYREKGSNKGSHNAFIGYGNSGGNWSHFHGAIDEFMYWDRALDEEEVAELSQLMIR